VNVAEYNEGLGKMIAGEKQKGCGREMLFHKSIDLPPLERRACDIT